MWKHNRPKRMLTFPRGEGAMPVPPSRKPARARACVHALYFIVHCRTTNRGAFAVAGDWLTAMMVMAVVKRAQA